MEEPLPDPFILPQNHRPDVELALKSGRMTAETRRAYITKVAGSIFSHKRYPTREEFQRIAIDMVRRYPFLQSPVPGSTKTVRRRIFVHAYFIHQVMCFILQGAIVQSLIDRFKEFRRPPRERSKQSTFKIPPQLKPSFEAVMDSPPIPAGEDNTSFICNTKVLLLESKKPNKCPHCVLTYGADVCLQAKGNYVKCNKCNESFGKISIPTEC